MRVRILRPVDSAHGDFSAGTVTEVPSRIGKIWCKTGIAMRDKSLDGPSETKVVFPTETK